MLRDDLRHSITYELGWRTLTDPSRRAAREVQRHFGHALKSSVIYTFRHSHWPTGFVSRGGHAWRCGPCLLLCWLSATDA